MADLAKSSSSSDKLEDILIILTKQQLTLTYKIDDLIQHVAPSFHTAPTFPSSFPHTFPVNPPAQNHRLKLDMPRFDGTDPLVWTFKINQFFEYHGTMVPQSMITSPLDDQQWSIHFLANIFAHPAN